MNVDYKGRNYRFFLLFDNLLTSNNAELRFFSKPGRNADWYCTLLRRVLEYESNIRTHAFIVSISCDWICIKAKQFFVEPAGNIFIHTEIRKFIYFFQSEKISFPRRANTTYILKIHDATSWPIFSCRCEIFLPIHVAFNLMLRQRRCNGMNLKMQKCWLPNRHATTMNKGNFSAG